MAKTLKILAVLALVAGLAIAAWLRPGSAPPGPSPSGPDPDTTSSATAGGPATATPGANQVPTAPRPETRTSVRGSVSDESGQSYPGVEVTLLRGFGDVGSRTWQEEATIHTEPDGSFRFDELATATYRFRCAVPGRALAELSTFIDANAPAPEIELVLTPGVTVRGTVRAGLGEAVAGATVTAFDERGTENDNSTDVILRLLHLDEMQADPGIATTSAVDGTYVLEGLDPEKRYRIRVTAAGLAAAERRYVPAGSVGVDFDLNVGGVLHGTLTCDGAPVEGATLALRREKSAEAVDTVGAIELIQELALPPIAVVTTDSAGLYRFDSLDGASVYSIDASAPGHRPARFEGLRVDDGQTLETPLVVEVGLVVEGLVRDPDGAPAAGASCRVQPIGTTSGLGVLAGNSTETTVVTGEDGRFRFDTLSDTLYSVAVRHSEYASVLVRDVTPGGEPLEVDLPAGAAVSGHVLDAVDGEPIPGAEVSAPDIAGQQRRALTDDAGRFDLRGLSPGRASTVVISAAAEGYEPQLARRVQATVGLTQVGTEFRLRRTGTVRGAVVDFEGRPIAGAMVVAIRPDPKSGGVATICRPVRSDQNGEFHLVDVLPGSGTILKGTHPAYIESYGEAFTVEPDRETRDLDLVLQIGGDVHGRVVDPEGNPIPGATVGVRDDRLGVDDPSLMPVHATTDEDGRYVLRRIQEGEITLIAAAPDFLGSQLSGVDVYEGHRVEDIDLHLTRGARVSGYVRDIYGKGIDGANVLVIDTSFGLKKFNQQTDENGYFKFSRLGPYAVDIEATAKHHAKQRISQYPVESDEVVIVLEAFGGIRGRVENLDGSPLERYNVSPRKIMEDGRVLPLVASRSFTSPTFEFGGLEPGKYEVIVGARGHAPAVHVDLEVRQKRFTDLPISRLDSGGVITGTIFDVASGFALPQAKITLVGGDENFHHDGTTAPPRPGVPRSGVPIADDGSFRISGIFYEVVTLQAEAPGMITQRIDVPVGTEGLMVEMQAGGEIAGVIRGAGGTLVGSQRVYLDGPEGTQPTSATTDRRGQFGFRGLLPGTYTVRVTSMTREEVDKNDPRANKILTEVVEVAAGETVELELTFDD